MLNAMISKLNTVTKRNNPDTVSKHNTKVDRGHIAGPVTRWRKIEGSEGAIACKPQLPRDTYFGGRLEDIRPNGPLKR